MPLLAAWMVLMRGRHRVEQVAQVAGAVRQALRGEEVDRVVEGGVDPLAGGELGLGWVIRSEVCCNCSRFDRTPAERTISDIVGTFLVYMPYWRLNSIQWIGVCHLTYVQTGA